MAGEQQRWPAGLEALPSVVCSRVGKAAVWLTSVLFGPMGGGLHGRQARWVSGHADRCLDCAVLTAGSCTESYRCGHAAEEQHMRTKKARLRMARTKTP